MKIESIKSSKFESFENDRIVALKEIVGGTWYIRNASHSTSGGPDDSVLWSIAGEKGDYQPEHHIDNISLRVPLNDNVLASATAVGMSTTNTTTTIEGTGTLRNLDSNNCNCE